MIRKKHGQKGTRLYEIWKNMKKRVLNANNPVFDYYGERGIAICPEWEHAFPAFYSWAMACYGETRTLMEWAELTGVNYNTLKHRLRLGWLVEAALEKVVQGGV